MKNIIILVIILFFYHKSCAQSVEIMTGNNFVFVDIQFLKSFDKKYQTTLFSRTRARPTYNDEKNNISFFSGAYLNYTIKKGFGGSLIGRIDNFGSDVDLGIHFYKKTKTISIFILPSISLTAKNVYSWFSIIRFRPALNEKWKIYTSLELFTAVKKNDHLLSTQRARLGLDYRKFQFGLAMNISEFGNGFKLNNENYGVFLRKEF